MTMSIINNDNFIVVLGLISNDKCQFTIGRSKNINVEREQVREGFDVEKSRGRTPVEYGGMIGNKMCRSGPHRKREIL